MTAELRRLIIFLAGVAGIVLSAVALIKGVGYPFDLVAWATIALGIGLVVSVAP